jgi:hypothetical protein
MRLALAVIVLLVFGVAFSMHERKSALERHLGQVATQLGSRHVHVHCQSFTGNLVDVTGEAGSVRFDASGIPADVTDLKRPICNALKRFPHDVRSSSYDCVLAGSDCPSRIFEDVLPFTLSRTRSGTSTASRARPARSATRFRRPRAQRSSSAPIRGRRRRRPYTRCSGSTRTCRTNTADRIA